MSVYRIVFSPTGGTRRVASYVSDAFHNVSSLIDLSNRVVDFSILSFTKEDVCFIAVPSFGGRVPAIAISRLKQIKGGNAMAILLATYGNRAYEDTLLELRDTLNESGFRCVAAIAAISQHSIMPQFAQGRANAEDQKELAFFAEEIRLKIKEGKLTKMLEVPGHKPYRKYSGVALKPKAGRTCNECKLCAVRCPVGAIPLDQPSITDTKKCITCMRCIAVCPQKARSIHKIMVAIASTKMKKACAVHKKNELFL